jgi:glycosyltransferase involved in cell wall biosynthesis
MRVLLVSSEHGRDCGLGISVARLGRLLAREHEVTVIHAYEDAAPVGEESGPPTLRQRVVDPSRLPPIAFSCDDHARSAAVAMAIEEAYGDSPPDYAEFPDYRGHALVPLQARAAGSPSLRGTEIAIRLRGLAELICLYDGTWPRPEHRMVFDLEHEALRLCDRMIHPGESVLETYRAQTEGIDFGGAERVRLSFEPGPEPEATPSGEGPLRILFAGRLQRVKGVLPLVEACLEAEDPNWRLTLVGGDTETAPMSQSVRMTIEAMVGDDERVEIRGPVPHRELQQLYGEHDLVAVPSYFEVWSNVALEAMRAGAPVLACPCGGLAEIVEDGVTGWLAAGTGREPIRRALEGLLADRGEVERVRTSGVPRARFLELTDEDEVLAEYRALLERSTPRPQKSTSEVPLLGLEDSSEPLVTGLVTYCGEHETVREAVDSLLAQTYRNLEVVVVNDGSFCAEDLVLFELAELDRVRVLHKPNGGESTSRNLGILDSDGDYLAFLDGDNILEPGFVTRAVAMIEADPEIAYVTSWLRFFGDDEETRARAGAAGYAPLGNAVRSDDAINSDGDSIALIPRRLFAQEGYGYEEDAILLADWELYRRLREDGRFGAVIPAFEANYRMRVGSVSQLAAGDRHALAWDEALSRRRLRALEGARS